MRDSNVIIEHKPEHYVSPGITVTIHRKPSSESTAEWLRHEIEKLLEDDK